LLEELDEGVIVFAEQAQLIELAAARLGDKAVKLIGGQGDNSRTESIERFQSGDVPYILCTTGAGGESISLNRADTMIVLQRPWNWKANQQMIDRFYKEGRSSYIYDVITPDTVEERVFASLANSSIEFEKMAHDHDLARIWLAK